MASIVTIQSRHHRIGSAARPVKRPVSAPIRGRLAAWKKSRGGC